MKEKDLKIKQKQDMLKVKKQQKEPLKVRPALQQKMKADYIRGKARKPSEKETSEASNQAEETLEDVFLTTGGYTIQRLVSKGEPKKSSQAKENRNMKAERFGKMKLSEPIQRDKTYSLPMNKASLPDWKEQQQIQQGKTIFKGRYVKQQGRKLRKKRAVERGQTPVRFLQGKQEQPISELPAVESYLPEEIGQAKQCPRLNEKKNVSQQLARKGRKDRKYRKDSRRRNREVLQSKLLSQSIQPAVGTAKNMGRRERLTRALVNTAVAFVKGILAALSGLGGLIVVFVIIAVIAALVSTAFGVFFSPFDDTAGTKQIAEIVAETNSEFYDRVNEIEKNVAHDEVKYHVVPDGGDQLFITNWPQVVAVFAAKTSGEENGALDVVTMDSEREELLRQVFWDMNELSYETERVKRGSGEDAKTKIVLHITLTSREYKEMIEVYRFTPYQKQALEELMKPEYAQMLSELVGTIGGIGNRVEITDAELKRILESFSPNISEQRKETVKTAFSLVGKVSYFWGGKSSAIGWDDRWSKPKKVTAAGSTTTGQTLPYGLDCSGFVDWVFHNTFGVVVGHGGGARSQYSYCKHISWSEAQPGDLVFYPDLGHVGIVAGYDEDGEVLIVHCAGSYDTVVVTGKQGFTLAGRPEVF